jgi:hypothetical protein
LWKRKKRDIEEVFGHAKQYGKMIVERVAVPAADATFPSIPDRASLTEAENMAIEMFTKSRKGLSQHTWGQVAHTQVKALTAAVTTLPVLSQGITR